MVELAGTDHPPFVGDEDALFGPLDQKSRYLKMSLVTVLRFALPEAIGTVAR